MDIQFKRLAGRRAVQATWNYRLVESGQSASHSGSFDSHIRQYLHPDSQTDFLLELIIIELKLPLLY
ncbi:hypothetical protein FZC78_04840 [Rossellomorea vietnamensis]|uniref:Uncharacterized protein n=1 Tax=Rossellomorea vietnamensis TaxID=218284 RepID=A0A5D4P236_9BACI|nr:hypothetical protein [Rossellomorea vietnamensis]TYS18832.1 hypothetical protein FZC78_04840 [Rossellomorea vietnamensis]